MAEGTMSCQEARATVFFRKDEDLKLTRAAFRHADDCQECREHIHDVKKRGGKAVEDIWNRFAGELRDIPENQRPEESVFVAQWLVRVHGQYMRTS